MSIKKGNVVELKSGGPKMTVNSIEAGIANCIWFGGHDRLNGDFNIDALKNVK